MKRNTKPTTQPGQPVVTAFRSSVYGAIRQIPRGKVTTYREVARVLGCRSPRAIGQALRHNPFAPEVPCHRVVASNAKLGGFEGATDGRPLAKKQRLLESEGVVFLSNGRVDPESFWVFPVS